MVEDDVERRLESSSSSAVFTPFPSYEINDLAGVDEYKLPNPFAYENDCRDCEYVQLDHFLFDRR